MDKHSLRIKLKSVREAVTKDDWHQIETNIQAGAIQLLQELKSTSVILYLASRRNREIATDDIMKYCLDGNIMVAVPVTTSIHDIIPSRMSQNTSLIEDKWGIPVPKELESVSGEELSVAIVPMLGADKSGYRIGYGKGYYDRFLARYPHIITIGLCPMLTLHEEIPVERHDIPLNYIVTEKNTLRIS